MPKFYLNNGTEISAKEFVEIYNSGYFLGNSRPIPRVTQNSTVAESEMERILQEGIRKPTDVYKIMAWKVGKIRHADSDMANKIVYAANWVNAESGVVKNYRFRLDMRRFAENIVANIEHLEKIAEMDPQAVLNQLKAGEVSAPKGIGTVYLITLLYFISHGKWPIYDRFAMMALMAITEEKKPGDTVSFSDLPEKSSEEFGSVMDLCKQEYIGRLISVFGEEYNCNRNVDRALWVYGHQFKRE